MTPTEYQILKRSLAELAEICDYIATLDLSAECKRSALAKAGVVRATVTIVDEVRQIQAALEARRRNRCTH